MTPDTQERHPIDERLRRGLEPDAPAVDRVVRRALAASPRRAAAVRWLAAATAIVLAVVVLWTVPLVWREPPAEQPEAQVSMVNVGSVIVLDTGRHGGTVLLSGASASGGTSWRGQMIIRRRERP
jgi:hypothetical protein